MQGQDTTVLAIFTGSGMPQVTEFASSGMQNLDRMQTHSPTWYFIYIFLLISFFAWIKLYYGSILTATIQASINFQAANKMFKNNSLLQNQLDYALFLVYFLSIGFLLYYLELKTELYPYDLQGVMLLFFNLGLLLALFIGRIMLHNIAGVLFNRVQTIREYLYNMFIYNKLSGLLALPLMFLLIYTRGILHELIWWISLILFALLLMMRLIRGLVFSYKKEVLIFYMFLYLCALEIIPLVLVYRWLEGIL